MKKHNRPLIKQKVRSLKNPILRKVRYELRSLLFLLFKEYKRNINLRIGTLKIDDSYDLNIRNKEIETLLKDKENLILSFCRNPINCSLCGNREENLIQLDLEWVCYNRTECHQRIMQNVENIKVP